jgi:hypothetical protein
MLERLRILQAIFRPFIFPKRRDVQFVCCWRAFVTLYLTGYQVSFLKKKMDRILQNPASVIAKYEEKGSSAQSNGMDFTKFW